MLLTSINKTRQAVGILLTAVQRIEKGACKDDDTENSGALRTTNKRTPQLDRIAVWFWCCTVFHVSIPTCNLFLFFVHQ